MSSISTLQDSKAIANIFRSHTEQVFGLCYYYLSHEADSEDVLMDVFEVFLKRSRRETVRYPKAFLLETARRLSLQKLRKRFQLQDENFFEAFVENGDDSHLDKELLLEQLVESIDQLEDLQATCIRAFYLHGMSYKEVAEQYQLELNTVKSKIQNGKRNLKILLNAQQ